MRNLPGWTYLDELTPIQNRWMEQFVVPSAAVIFPQWAKNQPKDFNVEYLLRHALKNEWDLTPEGWTKAEELGLPGELEKQLVKNDEDRWISNGNAARRIHTGTFKKKSVAAAKTMLTRKVQAAEISTNGKSGPKLRLSVSEVDALILKIRNDDLELEKAKDDEREDEEEDYEDEVPEDVEDDENDWYKF